MTLNPEEVRRLVQCLNGAWRVHVGNRLVATTPAPPDPGQLSARTRH